MSEERPTSEVFEIDVGSRRNRAMMGVAFGAKCGMNVELMTEPNLTINNEGVDSSATAYTAGRIPGEIQSTNGCVIPLVSASRVTDVRSSLTGCVVSL